MHKYRLLALDLDETLLNSQEEITDYTKRTIQRVIDQGIHVVFATGRGIQTAERYWIELGLKGPMVFVNGAEIWKRPGEVWKRNFIQENDFERLHQLVSSQDVHYLGYNTENLVYKEDWTENLLKDNWLKFGIRCDDLTVLQEIRQKVESWKSVEVTQTLVNNMEVTHKGITKETGILEVCEHLGVQINEVMAIGDSMNDYALLKAAGLGIAMGNAFEEIKEIADDITDTNERDGVAKAIEHYLLTDQGSITTLQDNMKLLS